MVVCVCLSIWPCNDLATCPQINYDYFQSAIRKKTRLVCGWFAWEVHKRRLIRHVCAGRQRRDKAWLERWPVGFHTEGRTRELSAVTCSVGLLLPGQCVVLLTLWTRANPNQKWVRSQWSCTVGARTLPGLTRRLTPGHKISLWGGGCVWSACN